MVTGNTYTWAGQFEKARDALLQASRLERDEKELVIIYDGLAKAASRMNRIDEAIGYCRAALEYSSEYANIHSNLAAMLLSQGKLDDARKHFKEVVRIVEFSKTSGKPLQGLDRLDPNDLLVYALENLATILVEQGKVEEAVSQFAKLLAIRPDDGEAHAAIAGLLAQLGRNREADIHRALSAQRSAKGK
jgi:tetratricopeptide (TPR) repeat protein